MVSNKMKNLSVLAAAGCALLALSAQAEPTTVVNQSFEGTAGAMGTTLNTSTATWTGNGTISEGSVVTSGTLPTGVLATSNAKKLSVQGQVTCAVTADAAPTLVDLMVQIAKPDEALSGLPEGDEGAQFALGVDSDGSLKAYTTGKGSEPSWVDLGVTGTEGSWKRVTLNFDYTAKLCQVIVDGAPALTDYGYVTTNKSVAVAVSKGSWYGLLKNTPTKLASVEVVGSTAIDEMVVKTGADAEPVYPAPAGDNPIPQNWYAKQGIAPVDDPASAPAPDDSGMTIAAKFQTGVSATSGEKFEIKSMEMSGADTSANVTLTVPLMTPAAGRKNVIAVKNLANGKTEDKVIEGTSVQFEVGKADSGVTKFTYQIKNVAK